MDQGGLTTQRQIFYLSDSLTAVPHGLSQFDQVNFTGFIRSDPYCFAKMFSIQLGIYKLYILLVKIMR